MTAETPPKRGGASRLLAQLRIPLGLLVLAVVLWLLPLHERLTYSATGGEKVDVSGTVLDDWRADEVRFEPAADWRPGPDAPPVLRGWAPGDGPVVVRRGEGADGGGSYGWQPAVTRVLADMRGQPLGAAFLLFVVGNCLVVTRWWRLLRAIGLATTWRNVFRLNFLGLFFNSVVPGLTGGDLVKAVIVVRESPGRRTDALVSVVVDRIIGLVALAGLAAVVILLVDGFEDLRPPVVLFLVGAIAGAVVYTNGALRRAVRFDALLAKLPLGDKLKLLDDAVLLYRARLPEVVLALAISLANHLCYITGVWLLGVACGLAPGDVPWSKYLVITPVANIVTALPITPGGLGVGEALYVWLFEKIGASASLGVAISLTFRLSQLALGLLGGLFLLLPGARRDVESARAA